METSSPDFGTFLGTMIIDDFNDRICRGNWQKVPETKIVVPRNDAFGVYKHSLGTFLGGFWGL